MLSIKSKKTQRGFTLVEVIVVAVIIAILAGVSIPLYLNYINDSRLNAASNAAGSAASFAGACIAGGGSISLLAGTPLTGNEEGTVQVSCTGTGSGTGSSLIIPNKITLTRTGNQISGHHTDAPEGANSASYAFAAPEGGDGGDGGDGG